MKKVTILIQIILYLLSPFLAFKLATLTTAVDNGFLLLIILLSVSQWLAIKAVGDLFDS